MKTLVIVSHPYPEISNSIKSLEHIIQTIPHTTIRNLESLYGSDITRFDVAAEQAAYYDAERVIFMFPVHWFNLTPGLTHQSSHFEQSQRLEQIFVIQTAKFTLVRHAQAT